MDEIAWYGDNSGGRTHEVGTRNPNELGIYDMGGNVWEWCWDRFGTYSAGAQTDYKGPTSGETRVFRGGGANDPAKSCRVSVRNDTTQDFSAGFLGFRLVLPTK